MKDRVRRPPALPASLLALAAAATLPFARAFLHNPIDVISRDFLALTTKASVTTNRAPRRTRAILPKSISDLAANPPPVVVPPRPPTQVTARHILLPKSIDVALALKQRIRNVASPREGSPDAPTYIVDAFAAAARKYSRDASTASDGGLLGTLAPQGRCSRINELDEACFDVPLGEVCGPVESDWGYHLLLVEERTNCPRLDGERTRIERGEDGASRVFVGAGDADDGEMTRLAGQQLGFWALVTVAGGVTAEVAAAAANMVGVN